MKNRIKAALLSSALVGCLQSPPAIVAQACQDDESMVEDYQKDISQLVENVKKESLEDFQKAYHQKTCLTKLSLCAGLMDGLLTCLDKAAQDATATKEQADAWKAKRERYAKLKEKIDQDRKALKASEDAKGAKALIEKFDLSG